MLLLVCSQDWPLALENQLVCSSLGTISPPPSFPQLPIVLCVGLSPHGLCSTHFVTCICASACLPISSMLRDCLLAITEASALNT